MKKVLAILCLLCLAQASYAARDRNYFEYDLTPAGAPQEEKVQPETKTTETVKSQETDVKEPQTQQPVKKRRRFSGQGAGQSNTYWDFGHPNYGFSGDIQ